MQSDINKIVKWCETCSMKLTIEKCMHLRIQSNSEDYFIAENKLSVTECEKDLDVLVSTDDTYHEQVNSAASMVNRVLRLIKSILSSWAG